MTFGERIKELRKAKKLTIQQLAKISELNVMTLSNIENGGKASAITITKLAKALDCDLDELWEYAKMQ